MIEQWDFNVRLIAIGASLLLLILLLAGEVRREIKVTLVGLLLGAAAYLLNTSPLMERGTGPQPFIDLVSLMTPFWIWMFARRLFENEPPRWIVWTSVVILVACWFTGNYLPEGSAIDEVIGDPVGFYIIHAVSLAMIADLIRVAFTDRADDLIEKRRTIRLWFPLLVAAQAGGILLFETIVGDAIRYPPVQLANAFLILALTLFAGIALLRTDPKLLVETVATTIEAPEGDQLSPSEIVLKGKLEAAMAEGFYRESGLSIAKLAEHLDTPEHRLRALINQRLGHRNFSAFLNRHRIAEAQRILADPEHVDLPVLTIAMDLGYNSLPTFNRAFRTETSMTPTDYRRQKIGQN